MTLGRGIIQGKSSKQKINTNSSTEAEFVGASDYIPWTIWAKWFLKEQGYILKRNIFYQHDQSAMKLESNGKKSARDKSRHINIRYFFITDVLKRETIELLHCPTERMIADYFTKPLQGALFKKMRDIIMGLSAFPDEERVILGEIVRVKSNQNLKKSTVEDDSTRDVSFRKTISTKNINGTSGTPVSYADAVINSTRKEIVRENINTVYSSSEGQALSKPSEQSFLKLVKL